MPGPQPTTTELRDTQESFGFLSPAPVEKDWYVVQSIITNAADKQFTSLDEFTATGRQVIDRLAA